MVFGILAEKKNYSNLSTCCETVARVVNERSPFMFRLLLQERHAMSIAVLFEFK